RDKLVTGVQTCALPIYPPSIFLKAPLSHLLRGSWKSLASSGRVRLRSGAAPRSVRRAPASGVSGRAGTFGGTGGAPAFSATGVRSEERRVGEVWRCRGG